MGKVFDIALSLLYRNRLQKAPLLLDYYGSAEEAWRHLDKPEMEECLSKAQQELRWIEEHGIKLWTLGDEDYPFRLRQLADRPLVLYGKGNLNPSGGYIVSIVGTRRPTDRGIELTEKLVERLHELLENVTIVSGGAYGIDIAAHRTALKCGIPTIIVPAHGLDRIYPYQHRPEAVAALKNGGLLTEFPSGTEPLQGYFLQRNRIVAGLSDATVVVESREHGGSLVTARIAAENNKKVFAFPGRPADLSSIGCNNLIRTHRAQLIDAADELVETMGWHLKSTRQNPIQTTMIGLMDNLTPSQQNVLMKLQSAEEGMHINFIVQETKRSYADVASDLMLLELQGLVRPLPGGIYRAAT